MCHCAGEEYVDQTDARHSPINEQGDHSPDNVKFPDSLRNSSTALGMLRVAHIMLVLVLLSVVGVGRQQCMFNTK